MAETEKKDNVQEATQKTADAAVQKTAGEPAESKPDEKTTTKPANDGMTGRPLIRQVFEQNEKLLAAQQELIAEHQKLRREIWYNRLALAIVLGISMYYIHLQSSRLGDVIGTLIEMFLPVGGN